MTHVLDGATQLTATLQSVSESFGGARLFSGAAIAFLLIDDPAQDCLLCSLRVSAMSRCLRILVP